MTLETFFQKFDQFADAPNAVDEFRKVILHLAVHGSLVEQSDEDEPASEMLQRLSDRKPSLLDSADLPKAWENVALGELLILHKGKKPSSLNTEGVGLPYLDIAALERGELRQFTEDEKCPRAARGDLVIVCDGSRSGLILDGVTGVLGSTVSKVKYAGFVRDYLKLFLRSLYDDLNGAKKGAAIPHLNIPRLLAIPAPIPPLAEQKRIVAKVDELMALCDRLEAQQQERATKHAALARASLARFADAPIVSNLKFLFHESYSIPPADLRKSIFTLAVQGKLVPQDPNDEPAGAMLKKIEEEKKRLSDIGELKADKKAWLNSSINPPHELPESWCWVRLQDVFEISRGGSPRPAGDPRFFGGPIPWITVGEVTKDSGTYLTETATGLTEEGAERSRFINPGDLLLTNSGATLGVPKISKIRGCMNDGVAVLRQFHLFDLNDFGYLYLTQQTPAFRDVNQGMGQPNLNTPIIAGWFFPLPPLAEQRRIVAKVEQLMALVDRLETQLVASRATAANLLSALVAELTGTPYDGKVVVPSMSTTGRRGRPRKSA